MTLRRIDADTEKIRSASKLRPRVAKLARLGSASGRMVLRIEIQDDLLVKVIAEAKRLALRARLRVGDPLISDRVIA